MTFLFETTVHLTVTAFLIILFKKLFKNKLSAKWQVYIWALLFIRLLVPHLPQSEISVFNAVPVPQEYTYTITETLPSKQPPANFNEPVAMDDSTLENDEKNISTQQIIVCIWQVGAAMLFTYFLAIYTICLYNTKKHPIVTDEETLILLSECKETVGIKRNVNIVGGGDSPMLMGAIKPKIVLPTGYTLSEKKDIIIHELCHLKNGDVFIIWLAILLLCIDWFNPVIWYSFFVLRRDIEVYCDERVLKYSENKKEYAALC